MRNRFHLRFWIAIAAAVAAGAALVPADSRAEGASGCATPAEIVRVAAVIDDGDLALEDGRTLRLAGLDLARATPTNPRLGETMRAALAERLVGRDVAVAILSPAPDRWERFSALVAGVAPDASNGPAPDATSVNERLVLEGWARMRPEAAVRGCGARFLTFEGKARAAGLGLWSDPYYAVVQADDRRGLAERTGAMALVEGTARLRRTPARIYLDLARGRYGVAATLAPRQVKMLARAGIGPENLVGSRLRVRGFLDDRFGPRIDVTEAGQIETLGDGSATPGEPVEVGSGRSTSSGDGAEDGAN